ncbi:MAG: hypothetical protein WC284_18530 [Candidimonas sp.]
MRAYEMSIPFSEIPAMVTVGLLTTPMEIKDFDGVIAKIDLEYHWAIEVGNFIGSKFIKFLLGERRAGDYGDIFEANMKILDTWFAELGDNVNGNYDGDTRHDPLNRVPPIKAIRSTNFCGLAMGVDIVNTYLIYRVMNDNVAFHDPANPDAKINLSAYVKMEQPDNIVITSQSMDNNVLMTIMAYLRHMYRSARQANFIHTATIMEELHHYA